MTIANSNPLPPNPPGSEVLWVPPQCILPLKDDYKNRTTKEYLEHENALAQDIRLHGIRNALIVLPEGEHFRLVCGQTRLNAARRCGLPEVPVRILQGEPSKTELLIIELSDNNMSQGFDLLAQAAIYLLLMRENNWTPAELCAQVPAAKPAAVSKALKIFEKLHEDLKALLSSGKIGPRLGYALSAFPLEEQLAAFKKIEHMKVERAEMHLAGLRNPGHSKPKEKPVCFSMPGFSGKFTEGNVSKVRALLTRFLPVFVKP